MFRVGEEAGDSVGEKKRGWTIRGGGGVEEKAKTEI